jgi:hypothetical protein
MNTDTGIDLDSACKYQSQEMNGSGEPRRRRDAEFFSKESNLCSPRLGVSAVKKNL